MDSVAFALLAFTAYLASAWLILRHLSAAPYRAEIEATKFAFLAPGFLAVVIHGLMLSAGINTAAGLNLGFFNALSLIAWLVALQILVASLYRPLENLGVLMLPLAALAAVLAVLMPAGHTIIVPDLAAEAHIVLSVLAFSLLTLAAMQAILLAVQDHYLHAHHPGGIVRFLPPLTAMESLLFQMIGFGFILLTLALLTGFLFLEDLFAQHLVHKTVLSLIAWLLLGILLFGRYRFGWRGRIAIRWTLGGFVLLVLAYFGSKFVLELVLQR
jgi:ABC-type uncharacterized transport system permease subunit